MYTSTCVADNEESGMTECVADNEESGMTETASNLI